MSVLVGKCAPDFKATAVRGGDMLDNFTLSQFKGKKYVVLFFYPLDFTFVCPTELHAFNNKLSTFEEMNTEVLGVSIDSHFTHAAWLRTSKSEGGIEGVKYSLISDINKTIARDYGVLFEDAGIAYRGLFLIDKDGIVRHEVINDLPLGRNVDEVIRMVNALQFYEKNGEVCPANWSPGEIAMKPTQAGLKEYFSK